jgi:16S rRNA (cytosine1402-N4)-methyltransferase
MPKQKQKELVHHPVLLNEVLRYLNPSAGNTYLDLTAGYGGHAKAVLDITKGAKKSVLVDRDEQAILALKDEFKDSGVQIIHKDFLTASQDLLDEKRTFDLILADLGVSSLHLDEGSRGFSIRTSGPLDMRMDSRQETTASKLINGSSEEHLRRILTEYGQEPKAAQIAKRIMDNRPIKTTDQLASIVAKAWPGHSRIHPATRTFQALRIVVNDELTQLKESLPIWLELLAPGGRLVIISFHSLEDRIVKLFLAENSANTYDSQLSLLTKKPVVATPNEIASNPRARSAKLRACSKNKNMFPT